MAASDEVRDDAAGQAVRWAREAGVVVRPVQGMDGLREVSGLLEAVWGRSAEGVPVGSEMLRSLDHAGGVTVGAYDGERLVGAACLTPATPAGSAYGVIAAVAPGLGDRGMGRALKQAQRAWALAHGLDTIRWTFDPLVGRNARFNLVTLGATATAYERAFYGRMDDALNGDDESDRLVATWHLAGQRAVDAARGAVPHDPEPGSDRRVLAAGPDHEVMGLRDLHGGRTWVRVPRDIVALRRTHPQVAGAWRAAVRALLAPALGAGGRATHLTRAGWYVVEPPR